jgi:hypothetical protein
MLTDSPPRKAQLARFNESDRIATLPLPPHAAWLVPAQSIEAGMKTGNAQKVRGGCEQFLELLSRFYQVSPCGIRVLASRPLRIRENWSSELFGDYHPSAMAIRVWMRTAVKKDITSFGTFLSTLCHEYCHHLDFQHFKFADSWHTRGFYERAAALYHHARGTPPKRLFWAATSGKRSTQLPCATLPKILAESIPIPQC